MKNRSGNRIMRTSPDLRSRYKQCYDIAAEDCTLWIVTDAFRADGRVIRLPFDIADELENLQNHETCLEQDSVPHKASSASCFCGLSSVSKAVVLTVSTRELRTDRRRAVAVGGGQPPTRQRRHHLRWLARSVVSGGIGRQVADSRGRPDAPRGAVRSSSNHIDELLVRPPPEATPASAGRRHILVVKVPPDVL